jgi:hypothetical protein
MRIKKSTLVKSSLALALILSGCGSSSSIKEKLKFKLKGKINSALAENNITKENVKVILNKIDKDGLKTKLKEKFANNGSYSFDEIENAVDGDFYYMVETTLNGTTLSAPISNTSDTEEVEISPKSTLASKLIADVSKSDTDNNHIPSQTIINNARKMVSKDIDDFSSSIGDVHIDDTNLNDLANGLTTLASKSALAYKTIALEKEYKEINALGSSASKKTKQAQYLAKLLENVCSKSQNNSENIVSSALAKKIVDSGLMDTTYTISDLKSKLNDNNIEANLKSAFDSLESNSMASLSDKEQAMMLIQRDLKGANISDSTELSLEQVIAYMYSYPSSSQVCNIDVGDLFDKLHRLKTDFAVIPMITKADIWNSNYDSCPTYFEARIKLFNATKNISSVEVETNSTTDLGSTHKIQLIKDGNDETWVYNIHHNTGTQCLNSEVPVRYTVIANYSDGTTATTTVDRTHYEVREAATYFKDLRSSAHTAPTPMAHENINSPITISSSRPAFSWDSPTDILAGMSSVPSDYKIKYTYEFSHVDKTDSPISPLSKCEAVGSSHSIDRLYSVNGFLLAKECNPTACASKYAGKSASNIVCRINVQTYLLDGSDSVVSQAAGRFSYFTK